MTPANLPDPRSSPWLVIAAPLGKVAAYFLFGQNILLLLAPLAFLLNPASRLTAGDFGSSLIALFSDPTHLLAIADLVAVIGIVILASAVFLILLGFVRGDRKVRASAFLLVSLVLVCLATWVPVTLYAEGRARGTVGSLDAVAATGGWSLAAGLLLVASLAYLGLSLRMEGATGLKLRCFLWPAYAAVNLLGSVAIAGFFEGAAEGIGSMEAFTLGLILKVTLIPVLGGWAYQDLRDRFALWAYVPLQNVPQPAARVPPTEPVAEPLPPPPSD